MVGAFGVVSAVVTPFAELEYDSVEINPAPSASMRRIHGFGAGVRTRSSLGLIGPLYFETIVSAHRQVIPESWTVCTISSTLKELFVSTVPRAISPPKRGTSNGRADSEDLSDSVGARGLDHRLENAARPSVPWFDGSAESTGST
jgi:hypothetical protein